MTSIVRLIQDHFWILHLFSVVLITGLIHAVFTRLIAMLIIRAEKTSIFYDDALLKAIKAPLSFVIWLLGLSIAGAIVLSENADLTIFLYLPEVKKLGVTIAISWGTISFIHNIEEAYVAFCDATHKEVDKTLTHALSQLLTVSVIITTTLTIMQLFGLPISGLLAFGGIGGAAIAFASKDLLGNFFGGLVIYLDRPFKVGDSIRSPDKQIEGTVEFIGWRITHIRTPDKRPLYVPNGIFLTISVENPSRMLNRRIKATIGLRYDDADKIDKISHQIKKMLIEHPEIDANQSVVVSLVEFGPSSLNLLVDSFTKTTNGAKFQTVQHDILLKILRIISANNAECAFPTQTLFMKREPVDERINEAEMA